MQRGGGGGGAGTAGGQRLDEGGTARSRGVVLVLVLVVVVQRIGGTVWVGAVVLGGRPGDDVGAVVRARASILAEVELERLNLSLGCLSPELLGGPHYPHPSAHSPGPQPAPAQGLGPGPGCHSGESQSPLLSPGPPQP